MRPAPLLLVAALAACTHGPPEDHVAVQNVALKPDGSLVAAIVRYERYRPATGLSAFPDGGVPRVLLQRADLYVTSVGERAVAFRGEILANRDHRLSFSPWLVGWAGDAVYFKITGCPGSPGDPCYGPLLRTSFYRWSPGAGIAPVGSAPAVVLSSSHTGPAGYLTVGTEPYGVSVGTRLGAERSPFMRFRGVQLEIVRPTTGGA